MANARDDTVTVINARTHRLVTSLTGFVHRPTAVAISPNGRRLYELGLEPGALVVVGIATGKPVAKPILVGPFPLALAITPDGRRIYVVHNYPQRREFARRSPEIRAHTKLGPYVGLLVTACLSSAAAKTRSAEIEERDTAQSQIGGGSVEGKLSGVPKGTEKGIARNGRNEKASPPVPQPSRTEATPQIARASDPVPISVSIRTIAAATAAR